MAGGKGKWFGISRKNLKIVVNGERRHRVGFECDGYWEAE
jgi:hypothetical protein